MASSSSSSLYHHHTLLLLLLLTNHVSSQTDHNITIGTTLTPPNSSLSPSQDFAFGFLPLETNNPSLFLLAIWFNKIAAKTIVWTANGQTPVANGSKLELTSNKQLSLKDPTGQQVWNPGVKNISSASILDTGNFVLLDSDSSIIWQSFDNPTDTILPGQVVNAGTKIYANLMDDDYSRGRFVMVMQNNGNLVLYPVAYPTTLQYDPYWSTGTSGSGVQLKFNQTGSIYLSLGNTSVHIVMSAAISGDNYQMATLDSDGIFRQYSFPKNQLDTGSWQVQNSVARNVCGLVTRIGSGACGFNSYCTLGPDGRVDCLCPNYYSFLDPTRKYKGCKPDFAPQSCEPGGETGFDFSQMFGVDWPLSDAEQLNPISESDCTDNCLKDCFCSVAMYYNNTCWKKKFPLSNGNLGSFINRKVLIKYSNSSSVPIGSVDEGKGKNRKTWVIVGSLILGSSVFLNLVQVSTSWFNRKRRFRCGYSSSISGTSLCSFTYRELEQATKGFSEELGRGAFGTVYKGIIPDSERVTLIAVKKLETLLEEAEKDFANEVNSIGQTHHKNLVRLFGFCKEGTNRLLVYEFMSNGSLNKFIFRPDQPEWAQRAQIAIGIAEGLAYLHEECRTQIIHCDIKPQNILLDENNLPKISDFGLAKLLRLDQTRTSTGIRGTIGYFAPEWFKNVAITSKVDVYSFGVMLLEIICCRRNFELGWESAEKATIVEWAKECYKNERLDLLVEGDEEAKEDEARLERFVVVGIACIQDEPWLRPSMKKVVQMLEGGVEVFVPQNLCSVQV